MTGLVLTKRTLEAACRLIEDVLIAPAAARDGLVVVALFQPVYFGLRERRFRRLAASTGACVVAYEAGGGVVPPGVTPVALEPGDPLTLEWSLVVLGPTSGAALIAVDLQAPVADEPTRRFASRCSFERAIASAELRRLRRSLALPAPALAAIDAALARPVRPGAVGRRDLVADLVVRYDALVAAPSAVA